MAKVSDSELAVLIEQTLDRYVSSRSVDPANVCQSVAEVIVRAINDAGITAIRDERDRSKGANAAVIVQLRQTATATD